MKITDVNKIVRSKNGQDSKKKKNEGNESKIITGKEYSKSESYKEWALWYEYERKAIEQAIALEKALPITGTGKKVDHRKLSRLEADLSKAVEKRDKYKELFKITRSNEGETEDLESN